MAYATWDSLGIFLSKPGKADYNQAKAYRTSTLSPVMLKLQEKVILWHMQHDLNIANDINKRQFGFRKGCSTEAALHKVTHTIERRIAKKGYVLGVFLDIGVPSIMSRSRLSLKQSRPRKWIWLQHNGSSTW